MKITIIGSGNIGTSLSMALYKSGHTINEIYSRNKITAAALARKTKAKTVYRIGNLSPESDLYIICVNDVYISAVAASFPFQDKLVVHTSGATPISALGLFRNRGVFYPLNTVSKKKINFKGTPFCIAANNPINAKKLLKLSKELGGKPYKLNDQQRITAHLAAVFVNNFSNALYQSAFEIMKQKKLPFELLIPLIEETTAKIKTAEPAKVQTGPALRGDVSTMGNHLKMLKKDTTTKKVYQLISKLIKEQQAGIK